VTRFIKKSMYLVILMSRFRPAMMHLVQSYDDRDNGTEGVDEESRQLHPEFLM